LPQLLHRSAHRAQNRVGDGLAFLVEKYRSECLDPIGGKRGESCGEINQPARIAFLPIFRPQQIHTCRRGKERGGVAEGEAWGQRTAENFRLPAFVLLPDHAAHGGEARPEKFGCLFAQRTGRFAQRIDGWGRREFQRCFQRGIQILRDRRRGRGEADNQRIGIEENVRPLAEERLQSLHRRRADERAVRRVGQNRNPRFRSDGNDEMPVHPSESERGHFRQQIAHNVSGGVDIADIGREDVARSHGNIGRDQHGDGESHARERSVHPGIHTVAGQFFRQ